jgi:ABC-type nitrate/sulfonate/bicarbonate transport system substrate-binding protein
MKAPIKIRIASGLRGTTHLMTWMGAEAGIFARHGLEVSFPTLTSGGPESVAGLIRGDWDFVHTGTVPIAESYLNGHDPVILARNTVNHATTFVMTAADIKDLRQLTGKKVGVLTDAYSGQAGVTTRKTIEQGGGVAEYVGLGSYENIYNALAAGEIAGGTMQIDRRYMGERQYGWNVFPAFRLGLPSVFATTRRLVAADPALVKRVMRVLLETIAFFKREPAAAMPVLQRALALDDPALVEEIYRHYAPLFPDVPVPAIADSISALHDLFRDRYPAADKLREADIVDTAPLDSVSGELAAAAAQV